MIEEGTKKRPGRVDRAAHSWLSLYYFFFFEVSDFLDPFLDLVEPFVFLAIGLYLQIF